MSRLTYRSSDTGEAFLQDGFTSQDAVVRLAQLEDMISANHLVSSHNSPASDYTPACPRGYVDCVCDPAYIQHNYPRWYSKMYGNMTPKEAIFTKNSCWDKFINDPDEDNYCYGNEDK